MRNKTLMILDIIAILSVLVGGIFVYFEAKPCKNPLYTLIQMTAEGTDNLDYSYATISFYHYDNEFPTVTYKLNNDGTILIDNINQNRIYNYTIRITD